MLLLLLGRKSALRRGSFLLRSSHALCLSLRHVVSLKSIVVLFLDHFFVPSRALFDRAILNCEVTTSSFALNERKQQTRDSKQHKVKRMNLPFVYVLATLIVAFLANGSTISYTFPSPL